MKVILIHDAPLNEWKGTQKALFELGNYLVQMGHTVTYLNNVSFKRSKTEKHLSFSKVPQFSIVDLEFRRFFGIWFIGRNILQQYKPDAIYIASLQSFYYIPFYKFNTVLSTFVIGPEHEEIGTKLSQTLFKAKKKIFQLIVLLYGKKNTIFHVLNPIQKNWLQRIVGEKHKVYMIPPPIDCDLYKREDNYKITQVTFNVLYLGPLTREKGFMDFVEIVHLVNSRLQKESDKLMFIIVGGGILEDTALNIKKMYENVRCLGTLSEHENLNVYQNSHLLVSPSYVENFHYVTAEAQLFGIPVLSSNISGPSSIIKNGITGKLIDRGKINEFVEALLQYYNQFWDDRNGYENMMKQISQNAKQFCKEKVLPLYEGILLSFIKNNI